MSGRRRCFDQKALLDVHHLFVLLGLLAAYVLHGRVEVVLGTTVGL